MAMAMVMAQDMAQVGEHGMAVRPATLSRAATARRIAVRSAAAIEAGTAARAATQSKAAFVSPIADIEFDHDRARQIGPASAMSRRGPRRLAWVLHLQNDAGILPQTNRALHALFAAPRQNAPMIDVFVWNEHGTPGPQAFSSRRFRGIASQPSSSKVSLQNSSDQFRHGALTLRHN